MILNFLHFLMYDKGGVGEIRDNQGSQTAKLKALTSILVTEK